MRFAAAVLFAAAAHAAEWDAVRAVAANTKVQVSTAEKTVLAGTLVRATADSIVVATKGGEVSTPVASVRAVKVADPGRRTRNGLIATAVGAGIGFGIGFAICPHCSSEGKPGKFIGPGIALGAGAGAVAGFLPLPYRTVYRAPRK